MCTGPCNTTYLPPTMFAPLSCSIPFHFWCIFLAHPYRRCGQPTRVRAGYVAAAFCGSSPQDAFLFARSPSHSPSSCTPVPVLYPGRRSRWSCSSFSSAYSAYAAILNL
jgi:hypothetical protein